MSMDIWLLTLGYCIPFLCISLHHHKFCCMNCMVQTHSSLHSLEWLSCCHQCIVLVHKSNTMKQSYLWPYIHMSVTYIGGSTACPISRWFISGCTRPSIGLTPQTWAYLLIETQCMVIYPNGMHISLAAYFYGKIKWTEDCRRTILCLALLISIKF